MCRRLQRDRLRGYVRILVQCMPRCAQGPCVEDLEPGCAPFVLRVDNRSITTPHIPSIHGVV